MGRGDKKSKKGKIWNGSYGVSRSRKSIKARLKRETVKTAAVPVPAPVVVVVEEKPKVKRAPRKKEPAAE